MKTILLITLLLLVGCGGEPETVADILDNYEMAFTQGYIWASGVTIRGDMYAAGNVYSKLDSLGYEDEFYQDAFFQGAYHCFDYATTEVNTRDVWLSNRINFLIDSLRIQ